MAIVLDTSYLKTDWTPYFLAMKDYATEYDKEQAMYDALAEKLGTLSSAVEGTTKAKSIYDDYNNKLLGASERFGTARNINTIKELGELRRMYGTLIKLLEVARDKMLQIADTRTKLAASGLSGDLILLNIGTLDDYLNNPNYTPLTLNARTIMTDTAALVNSLTLDRVNISKDKQSFDKYYDILTKRIGLTSKEADLAMQEAMTNGKISNPMLMRIAQGVYDSTGVSSWNDLDADRKVWNAIGRGLGMSSGKLDKLLQKNPEAMTPQEQRAEALLNFNMKMTANKHGWSGNGYDWNSYTYDSNEDLSNPRYIYGNIGLTPGINADGTVTGKSGMIYTPIKNKDGSIKKYRGSDNMDYTTADVKKDMPYIPSESRPNVTKDKKGNYSADDQEKLDEWLTYSAKTFSPINFRIYSANSSSLDYRGTDEELKKGVYPNDDLPGGISGYSYGGGNTKRSLKFFKNENVRKEILNLAKLQNRNLTEDDIEIWEDLDIFSNNHYRIVIKGSGERGAYESDSNTNSYLQPTLSPLQKAVLDSTMIEAVKSLYE